jgi:hypothetical protein
LDGTPEEETEMMGDAIYLMFEGAIVESKIYRNTWPVKKARRMTEILVKGNE